MRHAAFVTRADFPVVKRCDVAVRVSDVASGNPAGSDSRHPKSCRVPAAASSRRSKTAASSHADSTRQGRAARAAPLTSRPEDSASLATGKPAAQLCRRAQHRGAMPSNHPRYSRSSLCPSFALRLLLLADYSALVASSPFETFAFRPLSLLLPRLFRSAPPRTRNCPPSSPLTRADLVSAGQLGVAPDENLAALGFRR